MPDHALHTKKIQSLSRLLKWVSWTLVYTLPLFNAAFWIFDGFPQSILNFQLFPLIEGGTPLHELSHTLKFYGFLTTLIPIGMILLILIGVVKLLRSYEKLVLFSQECVRHFRKIGRLLLIGQIIYPLYSALISLILTISNPPGSRMIVVSFGLHQMALFIVALAILLISYIMEEGYLLKQEQASVI